MSSITLVGEPYTLLADRVLVLTDYPPSIETTKRVMWLTLNTDVTFIDVVLGSARVSLAHKSV